VFTYVLVPGPTFFFLLSFTPSFFQLHARPFFDTLLAQHEPNSNISKKLPLRAGLPVPGGLDGLDQTQAITKLTGSEIEAFHKSLC
jgi:hypothetical protein